MTRAVARTKLNWLTELRGADLTHAEFRVCVVLATFTDASMGNAFPGFARLAAESRVSEPTLKKALRALQSKGWVRLTQHGGNQYGKGRANVYAVCSPASKGDIQLPPSGDEKGDIQLPPLSRDVTAENVAPEGGKSEPEGGKTEHSEGGNSLTPHQVSTTSGHQQQVISSAHVGNARESHAETGLIQGHEKALIYLDQRLPGGFRIGERDRARELLDEGYPESTIFYRHLMADRNKTPGRKPA